MKNKNMQNIKVQTLIVTMNQTDFSLIERMNVQTEALVGNQNNKNEIKSFIYNGNEITYYSLEEKGVGLNRNTILMRANCKYAVLADDDMVFLPNYENKVLKAFSRHPDAAILLFNLEDEKRKQSFTRKDVKIGYLRCGKYGAARFALNLEILKKKNIYFSLLFGGGCKYGSGEDTLFLKECISKKGRIFAVPETLAKLTYARPSTWNNGVNEKWFFDTGASKAAYYGFLGFFMCLLFLIRHKHFLKESKMPFFQAYRIMLRGVKNYLENGDNSK